MKDQRIKNGDPVLAQIQKEFSKFRRRHSSGRLVYPDKLRELAASACQSGMSGADVADAAQVSGQSIINWRQVQEKNLEPCELKLVDTKDETKADEGARSSLVNIVLPSGVRIEVPACALSASLLSDLWGAMR